MNTKLLTRNSSLSLSRKTWFKIALVLLSILTMIVDITDSVVVVAFWIMLFSFYNIYDSRRDIRKFIVFGFIGYCNYSICVAEYFLVFEDTMFTGFIDDPVSYFSAIILLVFNIVLFLSNVTTSEYTQKKVSFGNNHFIVFGAILLLLLILVFGYKRDYSTDVDFTASSPLYEYSIIIMIMALLYSGNNKFYKGAVLLVAFAYIMQTLMFGGRIIPLQIMIMLAVFFIGDIRKIYKMIPAAIVLFILFVFIGNFRSVLLQTKGSFDLDMLFYTIKSVLNKAFTLDTAYSAYYTSQTYLKVVEVTTISGRLKLFFQFLLSMVIGGGVPDSDLSAYTRNFYGHYFGGVLPFHFYFYLGIIGIVLIALYIAWIFKCLCRSDSRFLQMLCVYFVCTVPRWYLYSPTPVFRGLALFSIVYWLCHLFDQVVRNIHFPFSYMYGNHKGKKLK